MNNFLLVFLISISILVVLFFLFLFGKKIRKRRVQKRSLDYVLFSVSLPQKTPQEVQESQKQEKQWIALMEDFFTALTGLKKGGVFEPRAWICLEIAKVKKEINFYISSPAGYSDFIEKQINGVYPDAQIEKIKDFNIFAPDEIAAASYLSLDKASYLPIKTYSLFEVDPLATLTNVLTKLNEDEEGVIQIVLRKSSKRWRKKMRKVARNMAKGKGFSQAAASVGTLHSAGEFVLSKDDQKEKEEEMMQQRPLEEELFKSIQSKANKDCFETNIRIIVSCKDKSKSDNVISQIENVFDQYSAPLLNEFNYVRTGGAIFKKLIYNFSFRLFDPAHKIIFSTEEITSLFHLTTPFVKTPTMKIVESKTSPAPQNLPEEGLLLGHNLYRGIDTKIRIKNNDRRRHMYIIGQTGTGKTAFIENLITQDIQNGEGVGVLDPHGDLIEKVLGKVPRGRLEDVIVFDPGRLDRVIGLNFLDYDPQYPEQKTFIVNELINIFDKLYDLKQTGGPIFEQYTRNALLLLMDDPNEKYTLMEVPKVLADKEFRHYLLSKCKNVVVRDFWEKEAEKAGGEASLQNIVPYITSKFSTFIANDYMRPIIGQKETTLNFREIIDKKKILLVNLTKGRLGEINAALLGLIINGKIAMAAFSRVDMPEEERQDFFLYMDEFQNFCTESVATILSEARKYRLSLIIAHQFIGQLPDPIRDAVFGNIGTIMSLRVGPADAEFLIKEFEPNFTVHDLIHLDNYNFYVKIITEGKVSLPFNMISYPPEVSDPQKSREIKEFSYQKYGRMREIIEKEIEQRRGKL
ncbi:MAG: type IV secretion system DNA-binding domain-containing protein [Candidatus Pacebacteria bacterium]|nr:type IV secretion system DNA-binding domain-containing protein [Candidatus Paceibacterota bacterium]